MFNQMEWLQGVIVFSLGLAVGMLTMSPMVSHERERASMAEAQLTKKCNPVGEQAMAKIAENLTKCVELRGEKELTKMGR